MENEKNIQPVNLQLIQADYQKEEISLVDIWRALDGYKYNILIFTFLCTLAAVIYSLLLPPVYQSDLFIFPPNDQNVQGLNILENTDKDNSLYTPAKVYKYFLRNLQSRSIRLEFFKMNNLIKELSNNGTDVNNNKIFEEKFNQLLSYNIIKEKNVEEQNIAHVQLMSGNAENSSVWLNNFVDLVNERTVGMLKKDVEKEITQDIQQLNETINRKREFAKKLRLDEIQRLSEEDAIKRNSIENQIQAFKNKYIKDKKDTEIKLTEARDVAKKLGMVESTAVTAENDSKNLPELMINLDNMPLYTRGVNALAAEINAINIRKDDDAFMSGLRTLEHDLELLNENPRIIALKNRESDDPFISELRGIQEEINRLQFLDDRIMNDTSIKAAVIDQYANVPDSRISPKRKLIVIIGFLIGLTISVFISLLRAIFVKLRNIEEQA